MWDLREFVISVSIKRYKYDDEDDDDTMMIIRRRRTMMIL
jgi:hypothetical protein